MAPPSPPPRRPPSPGPPSAGAPGAEIAGWLARVRHDLVKRLVWPARDRRDAGGAPAPGELVPRLVDDEGRPTSAAALWAALANDEPAGLDLVPFAAALARATAAAARGELASVLALEAAFDDLAARAQDLARSLEVSAREVSPSGSGPRKE